MNDEVLSAPGAWLREHLRCPYERALLQKESETELRCTEGHRFPIVRGVPVLLVDDDPDPTMWVAKASLTAARDAATRPPDDLFLDTLGVTEAERETMRRLPRDGAVDPVVSVIIPATSGHLYVARQGRFTTYPIPTLRLPPGGGARLLDVGCNWGRWCVAAARGGYRPVGIDPSLGAVLAAQRVASSLGITADFVVADARRLPFAPASFDVVFSYSVLQHFSRENVAAALREVGRVLASGGKSFVQMPNRIGVRTLYNQARRRFREAEGFDVRFWGLSELEDVFGQLVGPSTITVDGFFGLGIQPTDVAHMKPAHQLVCYASELLRHASARVPALTRVADSVYVTSIAR